MHPVEVVEKLFQDTVFQLTLALFILGYLLTYTIFYMPLEETVEIPQPHIYEAPQQAMIDVPQVLGRSYPLSEADLKANTGGNITVEDITAIIPEGTFDSDVYMRVDRTVRATPISVSDLWQVSDIWNVRLRYMSNDDEVPGPNISHDYILAFPYTEQFLTTDQGVRFDENNLKLIRGTTVSGPWEILSNTVIDTTNNTASTITRKGGYYFVAGGEYSAPVQATSSTVPDLASQDLRENEIVVTVTPSPKPTQEAEEVETVEPTQPQNIGGGVAAQVTTTVAVEQSLERMPDNFFTAVFKIIFCGSGVVSGDVCE